MSKDLTAIQRKTIVRKLRKVRTSLWDIIHSIGAEQTDSDLRAIRELLDASCERITDCMIICKEKSKEQDNAN